MCGQSKRLLGGRGGRYAPSHRPRGVLTKRHAGFQFHRPELAARLVETRACMSCFAFSGPTPSSPSSPGSMARSTASCSTCPEVLLHPTWQLDPCNGFKHLLRRTFAFWRRANIAHQRQPTAPLSAAPGHSTNTQGEPTALPPVANPLSPPTRALMLCLPLRHACLCAMPAMPLSSRPPPTPNFADTRTLSRCSSPS